MRKVIVVLTVLGLLVAGCGPAIMPAAAPQTDSGEKFVIALPRIVLTFDENGNPGFEGLPIEQLAGALGFPLNLSAYRIDPRVVSWMTTSNIQHLEMRQTGNGMALLVNGKLMPHLQWQDGSLEATGSFVRMLSPQNEQIATLVEKLAPLVKGLGLAIVVKFPLKPGAEAIALATDEMVMAEPVAANGPASAMVQFEVKYDEQGVPSIMGISARDLAEANINAPLALDPAMLAQARANNIQYVELRSKGDGLQIFVNGEPLPVLIWDATMLENTVSAAEQLYGPYYAIDWQLVRTLVPVLSNLDVSVLLHMPLAVGATPIPVKRH